MIKNERQYRITKAQMEKFEEAIAQFQLPPLTGQNHIHPILKKAEEDGLRSQLEELRFEVEEYEALRAGRRTVLELSSIEDLPRALIQSRIATGLSQKDLAERLGMKEQQVQRYESTDYASASLERIKDVINALGIKVREDVFLPGTDLSLPTLFKRLSNVGLDKEFVLRRLIPSSLRARLEKYQNINTKGESGSILALQTGLSVSRVFGWSLATIFSPRHVLELSQGALGSARFKLPSRVEERRFSAYTVYAHLLSLLLLDATESIKPKPIPTDANEIRQAILDGYGEITFENALRYIWSLGVPVLPLSDSGAFHGACWRVNGRNVIVLKQQTKSAARWLFDLLHELYHAGQNPELDQLDVIEAAETAQERRESEEELAASQSSGNVVLQGRAEELVGLCVDAANGSVERLSKIVPKIATSEGVDVGCLANYLAFRLSLQKLNWWGAATNLQKNGPDPLRIARDILLEHTDLSRLNDLDRVLLQQALSEEIE